MEKNPLLVENENKRLVLPLPMLACHAMFAVWQMGVMLFSGEALSIGGRTPFPIDIDNQTALIAAAYILSVVFLIFFQRYCVMAARIGFGAALLSVLALYVPFAPKTLTAFYYVQVFCCSFLIGVVIAICVNMFTEKTEIKGVIVKLIMGGCLIAFLHNEIAPLPFGVFQIITVAALVLLLLIIGLSTIMTLFGSVVAESIVHGISQAADGIMRGLRRSEIAKEMQILPESVTKYTNRIYDKFGIHRRQDLFKLAETLDREWENE